MNRLFAQKLFGEENPIGQRVTGGGATYTIIGVVGNLQSRTLGEAARPVLFRSLEQATAERSVVPGVHAHCADGRRTGSDDAGGADGDCTGSIRRWRCSTWRRCRSICESALFLPRLAGTLFGIFGGLGLLLAAVGLYGVVSYSVGRRTREIGIRIAVGATRGAVEGLIVRQGMVLTGIAVALGLGAAWMTARFCTSFLYGISAHDPVTFAVTPLFLSGVALLACAVPARRAARVDPVEALRRE